MTLKNVEKLEKSMVKLTIEVSAEELEAGKQAAYKKNVKSITVPGFRKGKAPRMIIEKMYGEGVFFEDAVNICYPEAYEKAVAEAGITPVDRADIDVADLENGFTFTATVAVEPEINVGEYKGLTAEKEEVKVLVSDVKAELERMAQRLTTTEAVERAAKNGDVVTIDFEGFVDGVAFDGGKAENHNLVLGSASFIPGFEEQLVGAKAGDEVDVNVTFPEEYHAEELKGKPAVFKCKVHSVQKTVMPKMDDEFAKDVSEFETLDELKADIEKKLTETRTNASEHDYEEKILDQILETLEGEIPDAMYEHQTDNIVQDFGYRIQMQGINLEQYVQMNGMDMTSFRKLFKDQAIRQVKVRLALKKIAELEGVEVSDEDVEAEYAKMSEGYGVDVAQVRQFVAADAIKGDLKLNKAMDIIKDSSKAKKKRATRKKKTEIDSVEDIENTEEN